MKNAEWERQRSISSDKQSSPNCLQPKLLACLVHLMPLPTRSLKEQKVRLFLQDILNGQEATESIYLNNIFHSSPHQVFATIYPSGHPPIMPSSYKFPQKSSTMALKQPSEAGEVCLRDLMVKTRSMTPPI